MTPKYVPVIRAMQGEFDGLSHLPQAIHNKILPLFELPKFTEKTRNRVTYRSQSNPTEFFLNKIANKISEVRGGLPVLIDIFRWSPVSKVESGEHVLNYIVSRLNSLNVLAIPVIGYDRWEDAEYSNALLNIENPQQKYCLRLESYAFEDMFEEEHFQENITNIIDTLGIDTRRCNVLLDFGDATQLSTIQIQETISRSVDLLSRYEFDFISSAGCSLTPIINGMVPERDSTAVILRREMIAWQTVNRFSNETNLVFGDYGTVSPNFQDDIIAPDANGKIKYTISNNYFVARGHSRRQGNKGMQMWDLSNDVINSGYYRNPSFSWGDERIMNCSNEEFKGNPSNWVAIDTNHHIHTVLSEVFEFERSLEREELQQTEVQST